MTGSIEIFFFIKRVSSEELDEIDGKLTGLKDDGEDIRLKVVDFNAKTILETGDSKAIVAYTAFTEKYGSLQVFTIPKEVIVEDA